MRGQKFIEQSINFCPRIAFDYPQAAGGGCLAISNRANTLSQLHEDHDKAGEALMNDLVNRTTRNKIACQQEIYNIAFIHNNGVESVGAGQEAFGSKSVAQGRRSKLEENLVREMKMPGNYLLQ